MAQVHSANAISLFKRLAISASAFSNSRFAATWSQQKTILSLSALIFLLLTLGIALFSFDYAKKRSLTEIEISMSLAAEAVVAQLKNPQNNTLEDIFAPLSIFAQLEDVGYQAFLYSETGVITSAWPQGAEVFFAAHPGLENRILANLISTAQSPEYLQNQTGHHFFLSRDVISSHGEKLVVVRTMQTPPWVTASNISATAVFFAGLGFIGFSYVFFRLAAQERAREEARVSDALRFDQALGGGKCGLWDFDLATNTLERSPSLDALLGFSGSSSRKSDLYSLEGMVHPDDTELFVAIERLRRGRDKHFDATFRIKNGQGQWIWLHARGSLFQEDGEARIIGAAVDVTRHMIVAQRTQEADVQLRRAVETISDAFVIWDEDDNLALCNTAFRKLHGLSRFQIYQGMPKTDVYTQSSLKPLSEELVESVGETEVHVLSLENDVWLQTRSSKIAGLGVVMVASNISELKNNELALLENEQELTRMVSELRQSRRVLEEQKQHMAELAHRYSLAKEKAEAANSAKANFLANISHELRTPLNAVIGFSEFVMSDEKDRITRDNIRSYCADINKSGRTLLEILDDILTMSSLEAGRIRIAPYHMDLAKACTRTLDKYTQEAEKKGISLIASLPDDLSLLADAASLNRIISNLVSNAIKFSDTGTCVRVSAYEEASHVVISVEDEGVGIPAKYIDQLGQAFVQVANCETRGHEGSGLGLAIVRSLTKLHGGSFNIESTCGVGTLVKVYFPKVSQPALCD